jgi:hypothetical protein
VWITVAGVLMTIDGRQINQLSTLPQAATRALIVTETVIHVLLKAAVLTAAGYCLVWRRRGTLALSQPGHWLVLVMAVVIAVSYGNQLTELAKNETASLDQLRREVAQVLLFMAHLLFQLSPWIFCVYIGLKKCTERRWRWFFFTYATAGLLQLLIPLVTSWLVGGISISSARFYYYGAIGLWITELALLTYAFAVDRQQRMPRDALHWSGVGLFAVGNLISLIAISLWWLLA